MRRIAVSAAAAALALAVPAAGASRTPPSRWVTVTVAEASLELAVSGADPHARARCRGVAPSAKDRYGQPTYAEFLCTLTVSGRTAKITLRVDARGRFVVAEVMSRAQQADAEAQTNVRAVIPSIESYYADHDTYAGMTLAGLKSAYDQGLDLSKYRLGQVSAESYCVESTVAGRTWHKNGPAAPITRGACP